MGLIPLTNAPNFVIAAVLVLTLVLCLAILAVFPIAAAAFLSLGFSFAFHRPFMDMFSILCPVMVIVFFYALFSRK